MIPVNTPLLGEQEKENLIHCIESGWVSSEGPFVAEFEQKMARRVGRKYGVAVSSGTAALDIAIAALEIKAGDEVIVTSFTIISCIHQILRCGAVPVFVDCDPSTWNMDVTKVEPAITTKTKAIMAVHIYGLPVDMESLIAIANQYELPIIEDSAEAIGQNCANKPCGSFGEISTMSFYPNKHVTTGEGGMLLTDNPELAERSRSLRNLCFQKKQRFVHDELGWNYRMTNLQAALGVAQVDQLDTFIERKKEIGAYYQEEFAEFGHVQRPLERTDYADNVYWVYGLVVKDSSSINAQDVMAKLGKKGIGTRPFFWPLHIQPVLEKYGFSVQNKLPNSEKIANNGFYLPSGLSLIDDELAQVAKAVKEILQ